MVGQAYERVRGCQPMSILSANSYQQIPHNEEDAHSTVVPDSPPPPFRSRSSSLTSRRQPSHEAGRVNQTLEETFGEDNENDGEDDRQRLIRDASTNMASSRSDGARPATSLPSFPTTGRSGPAAPSNDGVFANLSAKPERGEKLEDHPPVSISLAAS